MTRGNRKRIQAPRTASISAAPSIGPAGTAAHPRLKRVCFRALAVVLFPLIVFTLLEIGLRTAGFGYPTAFFLPRKNGAESVLVQNDRFGRRFFGNRMARAPTPFIFSAEKPAGIFRIFVLGGSAANGDPQPAFGLSRILESLLENRYPDLKFEVINAAMTAINSHVVLPIARDCASRKGDLWIVYMGNNEVVGPYGPGSVFGARMPRLSFVRTSLALRTTRSGQVIESWMNRIAPNLTATNEWGGMQMFIDHQIRHDDARMERVYDSFRQNLAEILETGIRTGTRIVISTVGSNLKNCGPFASQHRSDLSESRLTEWNKLYETGIARQSEERFAQAVVSFEQAAAIDDHFADLHFRMAQSHHSLGNAGEARKHYLLARDFDSLRFRCDSRLNQIIRETALQHESNGVTFVDGEERLNHESQDSIAGSEFFYEHVHLTFSGNYSLAKTIADHIAAVIQEKSISTGAATSEWISQGECERRLAWTPFSQYETAAEILSRINDPPFTFQADHDEQRRRLHSEIERLLPGLRPGSLHSIVSTHEAAIKIRPNDWVLHGNRAMQLQRIGNSSGAIASWERVAALLPHCGEPQTQRGLLLAQEKRIGEAAAAFIRALELNPDSDAALGGLAGLRAREGNSQEAIRLYERALSHRPFLSQAHIGLGLVLRELGRTNQANTHFRAAIEHPVNEASSLRATGKVCYELGWLHEALTNFTKAIYLDPADAPTCVFLGQTFASLGQFDAARTNYENAVQLDPEFAEAHFRFGFELGRSGRDAEALRHFSEAVRLKSDLIEARVNLGIALIRGKNPQQAIEQFRAVIKLDPANKLAARYLEAISSSQAK